MNTQAKGNITTGAVLADLLKSGKKVLIPFGDTEDYDIVIEEDGLFKKVQCKTGRYIHGAVVFNLYTVLRDKDTGKWKHRKYNDKVDYYGVYSDKTKKSYLVPVKDVLGISECSLRVENSKNKIPKIFRMANKYEI